MNTHPPKHTGDSIIEILLAMMLFSLILPAILATVASFSGGEISKNAYFDGLVFAEEVKTKIQKIKSHDWATVSQTGDYEVVDVNGTPTLNPLGSNPTPNENGYTAVIQISNVAREDGSIVNKGGLVDGATRKITITIDWEGNSVPLISELYITRTDNIEAYTITTKDDLLSGGASESGVEAVGESGDDEESILTITNGEVEPEVSLKSWWKMSGEFASSNAEIDAAPNGANNLIVVGSPTFSQGRFGNKVKITSPNDQLVASSSATLELNNQISLAAWARLTGQAKETPIVTKLTNNRGYSLGIDAQGSAYAKVGNGSTVITAKQTTIPLTDSRWHHLVGIYDGNTIRIYVDGTEGSQSENAVGVLGINTNPLYIGKDPNQTPVYFEGDIDDVQIYSAALTQDEVKGLLFSEYESPPRDLGTDALIHSFNSAVTKPTGTVIRMQVAFSQIVSGNCQNATYVFLGPDKTSSSYFETTENGDTSIQGIIPEYDQGGFTNPGRCFKWRALFFSPFDYGQENPAIKDVRFIYSP